MDFCFIASVIVVVAVSVTIPIIWATSYFGNLPASTPTYIYLE